MTNPSNPNSPPQGESRKRSSQVVIPLGISLFVFFLGMAQISQTAWFFLPILVMVVGVFLGLAVTPSIFLLTIPLALLLNRTGIGPEEWLDSLMNGGNPFFMRRGGITEPMDDLNIYELSSMAGWALLAAGVISSHAFSARYLAMRHSPFWTGEPVPESRCPDLGKVGMGFLLGLGFLAILAMFGWVMTELLFDQRLFEPRIVQMLRWVLVVGGALVVGLIFRIFLGFWESGAMDATAASGLLADAGWRDLGKPLNTLDRWLMWWRLGRRKKAETRWRRLLRGVRPKPVAVAPKKSTVRPVRKGGS